MSKQLERTHHVQNVRHLMKDDEDRGIEDEPRTNRERIDEARVNRGEMEMADASGWIEDEPFSVDASWSPSFPRTSSEPFGTRCSARS
jgi:hypothetical protein